ncbi:hypothetical protein M0R45_014816 [Rubus argutus]|uniref:Uncharacterized protein n=1 Tax=Rubus argutus TaxID=59490 RepID=A0AAW1XME9_RUBAR
MIYQVSLPPTSSSMADLVAGLEFVRSYMSTTSHGEEGRWWKKLMDVEAAKNQVLFSLPMILTSLPY